jgi:signal peptidase I
MNWSFALILFVLLVLTGSIWTLDRLVLRKRRQRRAQEVAASFQDPDVQDDAQEFARRRELAVEDATRMLWWLEYSVSFFPVLLFAFVLRSFVIEPFRIPSGSMLPTLQSGDLILVNKFTYGIRLPIVDRKIVPLGSPQRGDVIVFRYPVEPSIDYIKRVVGVPGDEILYQNKQLFINGVLVQRRPDGVYYEPDKVFFIAQFSEKLGDATHNILVEEDRSAEIHPIWKFPRIENCQYSREGLRCKVPAGSYFAMGDNRDNSADSRYWGFVPDSNIVGKAFLIWMNFSDLNRIGRFN